MTNETMPLDPSAAQGATAPWAEESQLTLSNEEVLSGCIAQRSNIAATKLRSEVTAALRYIQARETMMKALPSDRNRLQMENFQSKTEKLRTSVAGATAELSTLQQEIRHHNDQAESLHLSLKELSNEVCGADRTSLPAPKPMEQMKETATIIRKAAKERIKVQPFVDELMRVTLPHLALKAAVQAQYNNLHAESYTSLLGIYEQSDSVIGELENALVYKFGQIAREAEHERAVVELRVLNNSLKDEHNSLQNQIEAMDADYELR